MQGLSFRYYSVAVILTNIILLSAIIVLLWNTKPLGLRCKRICLPDEFNVVTCDCHYRSTRRYLHMKFIKEFKKASDKLLSPNTKISHPTSEQISHLKPKARIGGVEGNNEGTRSSSELASLQMWREDGNNMYLSNGISHKNGRLQVPFKGLYHVYSFVDMYLDTEEISELKNNSTITHAIFRSNIKYLDNGLAEEELIASFRSYDFCQREGQDMFPTFLSADVILEAGDEVYIKVCTKNHIRFPRKNYFGIHLV